MGTKKPLFGKGLVHDLKPDVKGLLRARYVAPPFTILHSMEANWMRRKRAWIKLGLRSEEGREQVTTINLPPERYGRTGVIARLAYSVFDPVLCETMYSWFCPAGGQILDPFAGGSVRGIVAAALGFDYHGIDLSLKQIKSNREQATEILDKLKTPVWVHGDSLVEVKNAPEADFVFSCPPYGNLEVYSDDDRDISNKSYEAFLDPYRRIIKRACKRLKENRFAGWVVCNFRDRDTKSGLYHDFVGDTIKAFADAGLGLYNEAILINAIGTLPFRTNFFFARSRKLGRCHQNVLIFVKGSWKEATKAIVGDLPPRKPKKEE